MKTFSRILSEVAQPNSEDELNFKQKHIIDPIDHTVAPESTFSGAVDKDDVDGMKRYRKNKRLADYQRPDDEDVYEAVSLKRDIPGQEDNDLDNDGDTDMVDAQYKYRRHAQIKKYKIDESWSDGISSRNAHMHASTAAKYRKKAKDFASMAKQHDKGSPEHNKHMANYHSAMAKSIKSSYHAGDYGSVNTAKRDHKAEMDKAKEYKSSISEGFELDEAVYVIPEEILATEKNAFHTAAANAHAAGKKHFAFAGKKYPVTMSKGAAKTFAGKGGMSEAMDPVGKEDDDINNDGKINKSDKYLHARRKAISASIRTKIKEGFGASTAAGGDYDEEESHARYKKSNISRKENVTLAGGKGLKIYAGKTKESDIAESEELDEISKDTVRAYKYKAMMSEPENDREYKNRSKGIERATDRLTKEDLDEAVEVRHDRYMRSHGKKAGGTSGTWMFTHKDRGDVDYNNKKEVHTAQGKFSDAKKSAQQWAKEHGHHSVYVMEEVEQIDELKKSTLGSYIRKASVDAYRRGQDVEYHNAARDANDNYGAKRRHAEKIDKARAKASNRIVGIEKATQRLAKEEVEQIDEISKSTLGSYATKALQRGDIAARMSKSDTDDMGKIANKRLTGAKKAVDKIAPKAAATRIKTNIDKSREAARNRYTDKDDEGKSYYAAQKGIAKVREEVEQIDELKKSTLASYVKKAAGVGDRNSLPNAMRDQMTAANMGDKEWYKDSQRKANKRGMGIQRAADRLAKEEVELDEAFNAGSLKLNDGSSVSLKPQDAKLLNQLIGDLKPENAKKMLKVAMTDKHGFNEILGFAREAL